MDEGMKVQRDIYLEKLFTETERTEQMLPKLLKDCFDNYEEQIKPADYDLAKTEKVGSLLDFVEVNPRRGFEKCIGHDVQIRRSKFMIQKPGAGESRSSQVRGVLCDGKNNMTSREDAQPEHARFYVKKLTERLIRYAQDYAGVVERHCQDEEVKKGINDQVNALMPVLETGMDCLSEVDRAVMVKRLEGMVREFRKPAEIFNRKRVRENIDSVVGQSV